MLLPWPNPPVETPLGRGEVHVWAVSLAQTAVSPFWDLLDPDEQARAERFHFDRDRRRYVVARGVLRRLLGRYLGAEPQQIGLGYSKYGKPFLLDLSLEFNVSHSQDVALLAFCRESVVGVDVEEKRPLNDIHGLAKQVFSPQERQALAALPLAQQQDAFFTTWARKEAFIKAVGEGFSYPVQQVDVTLGPAATAKISSIKNDIEAAAAWYLVDLPPLPHFAAALVLRQANWQLACWRWASPPF